MIETLTWIDPDGSSMQLPPGVLRGVQGRGLPPVQITAEPAVGRHGTVVRQVRYGARRVSIPILIDGTDSAVRESLRAWARRLDPTRGVGVLRAATMVGDVRELRCRYVGGLELVQDLAWVQQATVEFEASDPMWLGPEQSVTRLWNPLAGSFFPILPLTLTEPVAPVQIDNSAGDDAVRPVITITGPCDVVVIGVGADRIGLRANVAPGDVRVIDCDRRTMVDGAGADRWIELERIGSWLHVPAGEVGYVRVLMLSAVAPAGVTVSWRTRHLTT